MFSKKKTIWSGIQYDFLNFLTIKLVDKSIFFFKSPLFIRNALLSKKIVQMFS